MCTAVNDQSYVRIVPDGAGGAIICWVDYRGSARNIYVQRLGGDGSVYWDADGIPLCPSTSDQRSSVMVSDHAGGAFITWQEARIGYPDIYVQRIDTLGNILGPAGGLNISNSGYRDISPEMIPDGSGGAIIAFSEVRPDPQIENIIHIYLYAQRIDDDFYLRWPYAGGAMPVIRSKGERHSPQIASDGTGGAFFAWLDYIGECVYVARLGSNGIASWPIKFIADPARSPEIVSDENNGAIITITYEATLKLLAMRIDGNGSFCWEPEGIDLGAVPPSSSNDDAHLTERLDGGNVLTVWQDGRNADIDIYAQCFDTSGTILWDTDAAPIVVKAGSQRIQALAGDGSGGAIILWQDNGIFAQRIDSSGMPLWHIDGVLISSITASDAAVSYVDSTAFITTWVDDRGLDEDVYASRTRNTGEVIVATLLQSHSHNVIDGRIVIEWVLSEPIQDFEISILRKINGDGSFEPIKGLYISQNGSYYAFEDEDVFPGSSYIYRVTLFDGERQLVLFDTDMIFMPSLEFVLYQNYPNPFNPTTTIKYYLPENCSVLLEIFDVSGKRIAILVNESQEKGQHALDWNGQDLNDNPVGSGAYFYRLTAGKETISKKMVLLR